MKPCRAMRPLQARVRQDLGRKAYDLLVPVRLHTRIANPTLITNPLPDNPTASTGPTPEAKRDRVATPIMNRSTAKGSRLGRSIAIPFFQLRSASRSLATVCMEDRKLESTRRIGPGEVSPTACVTGEWR